MSWHVEIIAPLAVLLSKRRLHRRRFTSTAGS